MEFTAGRLKQLGALLLAIVLVLAAGTVVGQAPIIFGSEVADPPVASIEFTDQYGDGTAVTVDNVSLSEGGFVVITDEKNEIVGISGYLEAGDHEDITIEQQEGDSYKMLGYLTATAHHDDTDDERFVYEETDGESDRPYAEDGYPVSETASVTIEDRDGEATDTSFIIDAIDAPELVATDSEAELVATVSNPTEFETRQHVELRIDGDLHERQVLSLEGNESQSVSLDIDVADLDAGEYTYGVHTAEAGELGEFEVVDDGSASISALEGSTESVTVDVSLPEPDGGFVAAEADGEIVGTSDSLEAGSHDAVTVSLEDVDSGESVRLVAASGDPDDLESATAYTDDGETVATEITAETE